MLTLRCFGEVATMDPRGLKISMRSRKHTGLLLYLVANPHTVHVRDELAYLLWDGHDRKARHSLSQALYDIRSNLSSLLSVDGRAVRLLPNRIVYELDAFERAFQAKDHETVIELYRGAFAPELSDLGAEGFDRWLDNERERCRVLASLALRNVQREAEASGTWDQVCLAALRLVRLNEFDEEAHCALMRGLCMKGDPASALAHYRSICDAEWTDAALKLTEVAEWAGGRGGGPSLAVHEPGENRLSGRDAEFRQLSGALRAADPVPVRIAVAGERGMGRSAVVREFARVVQSAGGTVQWLASRNGEPLDLADELRRHARKLRLLVMRADTADWIDADAAVRVGNLSRSLIVGLSDAATARRAEGARLVDFVLAFDPLDEETCATLVRASDHRCTMQQAVASARLSGGNPGLARAIAAAWVGLGYEPEGNAAEMKAGRFAYERSADVRSLVDLQLAALTSRERRLVGVLSILTPTARRHAESIVAKRSCWDDLDGLKEKGWIGSTEGAVRLSRPLAGYVVAWGLKEPERRAIHVEAAETLQRGSLSARAAAACELAAGGRSGRAFRLAVAVASEALREGRSRVAGQSARLALEQATETPDRLRSGLSLAEAELQRGRVRRATAMLHQMAAIAESGNDVGRVHLALARAVAVGGDEFACEVQQRRLIEAREHATDDALGRAMSVQLDVLAVIEAGAHPSRRTSSEALRRRLVSLVPEDGRFAGIWCEAFRLHFGHTARRGTRSEARLLLEQCRYGLAYLGYEGSRTIAGAEFWVAMRRAELREALDMLQRFRGPPDQNRYGSAGLNNLGAALLELGEFDAALERLRECRTLDEELESPATERAYVLLNQAQCAFFKGDLERCGTYIQRLFTEHGDGTGGQFAPQAWALNGLMALALRDEAEIRASRKRLEGRPEREGNDDSYLIPWFLASAMGSGRRPEAVRYLVDAAERTAPIDRLSARKLRVLAGTFAPSSEERDHREARGALRAVGAAWFVRFADSWSLRLAGLA